MNEHWCPVHGLHEHWRGGHPVGDSYQQLACDMDAGACRLGPIAPDVVARIRADGRRDALEEAAVHLQGKADAFKSRRNGKGAGVALEFAICEIRALAQGAEESDDG